MLSGVPRTEYSARTHWKLVEAVTGLLVAEKYGKTHMFAGNADTRLLLYGTGEEIYAEAERCMKIGKHCPGFFMAVEKHIPDNTLWIKLILSRGL